MDDVKRCLALFLLTLAGLPVGPAPAHPRAALPPEAEKAPERRAKPALDVDTHPLVERLIEEAASESEARRRAVFHGRADQLTDPRPTEQARLALQRGELDHPALSLPEVDRRWRAEALLESGRLERVLEMIPEPEDAVESWLRIRALEGLGRDEAMLEPLRALAFQTPPAHAPAPIHLAHGRALVLHSRFSEQPARHARQAMRRFAAARKAASRLYWPAALAEARLLALRHNPGEARDTLMEVLSLNPNVARAWYLLGRIAADAYAFDVAETCRNRLETLAERGPLGPALAARIRLIQRDPRGASTALAPALKRWPGHRELLALDAAASALAHEREALDTKLEHFDALSPGHPLALATAGRYLAAARQYEAGERLLRRAIARRPPEASAHSELGLLLMQAGRLEDARAALERAEARDPFNVQVENQLEIARMLAGFETIETEHFIIRYAPGIDRVLARDMARVLEPMYRQITRRFDHRPRRRTQVEILPDAQHFAVRITGIPEIWTIAASTGDVLAMTPPRTGAHQRGAFDWYRVMRHEFTHTVTLDRTGNRIPHWFTEACAVSEEPGGRDFQTARLLAGALEAETLFALDEINWAFIRPRTPEARPLAYAQSHWLLEYIVNRFGHETIRALLDRFEQGDRTPEAIEHVTGERPEAFMAAFRRWAAGEVAVWGLAPPADKATVRQALEAGTPRAIEAALERHPEEPALLRAQAERALEAGEAGAVTWLERYAAARPLDPWPHQQLAEIALAAGDRARAIAHFEVVDGTARDGGALARRLAKLHREAGNLAAARAAIRRALERDVYRPAYRETAAALALEDGDPGAARRHIEALTRIEPEEPLHRVRLAALLDRLGESEAASAAARAARELDPDAPVDRWID